MPAYHIERSILLNAPLKEVNDTLRDFKQWPKWSPWLIMEPDAVLTYTDRQGQVGATYAWAGLLVGAGSMELLEVHPECLKMQLNLVEPYRSTAVVSFDLEESDEGVKVTWKMDASLPFFMFWMKSRMQAYIGMDYERGLRMFKEYMERGKVSSFVHIEGVLPIRAQRYVGIPRSCTIQELGEFMRRDFETLYALMEQKGRLSDRIPFSIYNRFDIPRQKVDYVACIPVDEDMPLPPNWVRGEIPPTNSLKTMHKGEYMHLGNAWMTAMHFARVKKMKRSKSPVGYEFYLNDPSTTLPEELATEIYLPLLSQ